MAVAVRSSRRARRRHVRHDRTIKPFSFWSAPNGYWSIEGEPYTVAPGSEFRWFRSRILGGRTNHYGRITLRFSDYDFKPYSTDGLGTDWPISYEDVVPYYEKVERFIGVTRHQGGHSHRARRHLPAAACAARS